MKNYTITFFFLTSILISCSKESKYGRPDINLKIIENDNSKWWQYYNENIVLSSDFISIDEKDENITKDNFLIKLTSGNFYPVRLISKDTLIYYKLFETNNQQIKNTIKNISKKVYKNFKMEGKKFPNFKFEDINGIPYNNENIRNKTVILKCWFINCAPCISEFPELNLLEKKYRNRKDILFLSLTFDTNEKLKEFLAQKPFNYIVVPNKKSFLEDTLNVKSYPTHFIIDKTGVIRKVVNTVDELKLGIKNTKILAKNTQKRLPPPPPSPK